MENPKLALTLGLLSLFISVVIAILSNRSIKKTYQNEFAKYANRSNLIGQKKNHFDVIWIYRYLMFFVLYFVFTSFSSLFINLVGDSDFVVSIVYVIFIAVGYVAFMRVKTTMIRTVVTYSQKEEAFSLWFHVQSISIILGMLVLPQVLYWFLT